MTIATRILALIFFILAGTAWAAPAAAAGYGILVTEESQVGFTSKQMGVPVSGEFRRFKGQIQFDPQQPQTAQARIEVELASIDAGSREANEEVVSKDWFFVSSFPSAVFTSKQLKPVADGEYELQGVLSIKGHEQKVVARTRFEEKDGKAVFQGSFILKRLDFGIGVGPWGDTDTVADEVEVSWRLTLLATE